MRFSALIGRFVFYHLYSLTPRYHDSLVHYQPLIDNLMFHCYRIRIIQMYMV